MYNDFLFLNYWKSHYKIKKIREMLNRLLGGALYGGSGYADLLNRLNNLEIAFPLFMQRMKDYQRKGWYNNFKKKRPPTEEVEVLPDLVVSNIAIETRDHYALISVTVKNVGEAIAGGSTLKIAIDGASEFDELRGIPALDTNEEATVTISYPYDSETGNPKTYSVTCTVDVNNVVEEENEGNNILTGTFSAYERYEENNPPASGEGYVYLHMHNPEGVEINSLTGVDNTSASLDVHGLTPNTPSGYPYAYGAHNEATHLSKGDILQLPVGNYIFTGKFNGMEISRQVTIADGQVQVQIFNFSRTTITNQVSASLSYTHNSTFYDSDSGRYSDYFTLGGFNMGVFDAIFGGTYDTWNSIGQVSMALSSSSYSANISGVIIANPSNGEAGNLGMGLHHYPWMGGTYIGWGFQTSINPGTITNWYAQHGNSNNYVALKTAPLGWGGKIISFEDFTGWRTEKFLATVNPIWYVVGGGGLSANALPNAGAVSDFTTGYISNFLISSVPKNMDGLGIMG